MAVLIPTTYGIACVKFNLNGAAGNKCITFGYKVPGTGAGSTDPNVNAATISAAFTGSGALCEASAFSSDYSYTGVDVNEEHSSGRQSGTFATNVVGTVSASSLPPNCAFLVKKTATMGGRKYRGRWFLPPAWVSEGNVYSTGFYAPATTSALQTKLSVVLGALNTSNLGLWLLHSDTTTPTVVTALVLQPQIATQRRRLR